MSETDMTDYAELREEKAATPHNDSVSGRSGGADSCAVADPSGRAGVPAAAGRLRRVSEQPMTTRTLNLIDDHRRGRSSGDCAEHNGWISAKKMLPRLTAAERKPGSFGRQVLIYPPIQEPGCADQHTAFYGCRLTDEPAFYLHGRVIDVEWWQPLPEPPRVMPFLNLTDDHRRLHLRQSEVEPTLVCALLFVADRPMAYAHADVQWCRFSMSSDGPLFWVGDTNFLITEQERREIERFLWDCRPLLNAETMFSGRMNQVRVDDDA